MNSVGDKPGALPGWRNPLQGIAKGAMTYPDGFPNFAGDPVEAEELKAERDLREYRDRPESRPRRPHTLTPQGGRLWTDDEEDTIEYILRLSLPFVLQACELNSHGWSVKDTRQNADEFLRRLTLDATYKNVRDMRRCEFTGTLGNIQPELRKEFEKSAQWRRFGDAVLALGERRPIESCTPLNPSVGG